MALFVVCLLYAADFVIVFRFPFSMTVTFEVSYRFDPTRLTMVADTASGAITMNRMCGGTNALANHLLAFFCLHKWFADQKRPVPHFLMLDQISQAYYPADYAVDPNDDERLKVMQMYDPLSHK